MELVQFCWPRLSEEPVPCFGPKTQYAGKASLKFAKTHRAYKRSKIRAEGSYPSHTGANSMSNLKPELEHIKHHIKYPANKTQVLAACNNMTDVPSIDKEFVTKSLTDNNYKGPEDVVRALLNKV